jgi:hypothetical protein
MGVTTARQSRARRIVRRGKPRRLLSAALVSLVGYLALAVFAAQQQFFALDYGTRTWVFLLRYEALNLPMELVTQLGDRVGLVLMIAIAVPLLWRVNRRWAVALPVLMAGAGACSGSRSWRWGAIVRTWRRGASRVDTC